MGEDTDRARALAALRFVWDWPLDRIAAACEADHGPGSLLEVERGRLAAAGPMGGAPAAVAGDYPDWLDPHMGRVFGEARAAEGQALAARAPLDLRVNTLKTDVAHVLKALAPFRAAPAGFLDTALRIDAPAAGERSAAVEVAPAFGKGWFEVQDLGSQIAAAVAGEIRGKQVLDFCAGGGGKTLALAAAMGTPASSTPMTPTPGAWPTPSAAPSGPGCATSRSAPDRIRTPSRAWKAGWTWCSPTPPAPDREPGGATPTPNGASAPSSSPAGWASRTRCSPAPRRSSNPAAGWFTSPVLSSPTKTRTGWPPSSPRARVLRPAGARGGGRLPDL